MKRDRLLVALVAGVLSGLAAEGVMRLLDHEPWRQHHVNPDEPIMAEPDPLLGWRGRPGAHQVPPFHPEGHVTRLTILDDGSRRTRDGQTTEEDPRPKIVFIGGSFTQGFALSDDETLPWKVQAAFPDIDVLNHGISGYGTFQSLLLLEQFLATSPPVRVVVYGLNATHEQRNVATSFWLAILSQFSRRGAVSVPFVTLSDDGELERHPPQQYPATPLREQSALITAVERAYVDLAAEERKRRQWPATQRLLLEMQRTTGAHGAQLVILLLNAADRDPDRYRRFAEEKGLVLRDCAFELTEEMRVRGDGHPNGRMTSRWAKCLTPFLRSGGWLPP